MGLPQIVVHRIDRESPLLPTSVWYDAEGGENHYPPHMGSGNNNDDTTKSETPDDPLAMTVRNNEADFGAIHDFLQDRDAELVVLVEGTDEGTGQYVQARHSYKTSDIAWNKAFAECVYPYNRRQRRGPSSLDPVVTMDFSKFHDLVAAPLDCDSCPHIPANLLE
jgi:hypothetical protein